MSSINPNIVYTSLPLGSTTPTARCSKSLYCILAVLVGCVVTIAIIALTIYDLHRHATNSRPMSEVISNNNNSDICSTDYCIKEAQFIRNNMDETMDPCENFYEFTCGSFMRNSQILPDGTDMIESENLQQQILPTIAELLSSPPSFPTTEPMALRNARQLYTTCMDEDAIDTYSARVIDQLIEDQLGGRPFVSGSSWNNSMFDLSATLLKLNQYDNFPFFHVQTIFDNNSPTSLRYYIEISPARRLDSLDESSDENMFSASTKRFIRDLMLMQTGYQSKKNHQTAVVPGFEQQLNNYLLTSSVESSSSDISTTVKDLTSTIDTNFDFSNYIRRLYQLGNVTLMDDDIVIVRKVSTIRETSSLLAEQTPETLQTYMIRHFIASQSFHVPAETRTSFQTTIDTSNSESRSIGCARYVNRNMPFAVAKLYIDQYYDPSAHQEVVEMVQNIRNTFIDMINSSTWMDSVSKKRTIEKAKAIVEKVGYPEYLEGDNMTELESMYAEYQFTSSHMNNVLRLRQISAKANLQLLREPINRQKWTNYDVTVINAFYTEWFNDINIPPGYLQPPRFHKNVPKYLNYGGIGSLMGHEIAHGFDDARRHIDHDGSHYSLWSKETNMVFDRRSKCLVEQYDNYTVQQIGRSVNGEKTRDENIADTDGLKKAFYAYQKWAQSQKTVEKKLPGFSKYSAEQMFFIRFGQSWCSKVTDGYAMDLNINYVHSPTQFRVIGATSNLKEFDRAFSCKLGQGNSRVNKCEVW